MLLLLLTACDPGFNDLVNVVVVEEAVELYSPEAPGVVTVSIGDTEPHAVGLLCGGQQSMEYTYQDGGIGCGSAGLRVEAALWPVDAFTEPDELIAYGCGSWEGQPFVGPAGDPDFFADDTMFDYEDEEAKRCGGNASALLHLGSELPD